MPTRVFIAISGDVIQVSSIIVPFTFAFMIMLLSVDTTFGLPVTSAEADKIGNTHEKLSRQLVTLLQFGLALIVVSIVGKSLALWFLDSGWLAVIVMRFAAWTVGGLLAVLIIRKNDLRDIFGYLSVGVDLGRRFRAGV